MKRPDPASTRASFDRNAFLVLLVVLTLAFAWVAYPFTLYVSSANTNDALPPLFLIWGFWLVTSSFARGVFSALAGWTKFAALLVAGLGERYNHENGAGIPGQWQRFMEQADAIPARLDRVDRRPRHPQSHHRHAGHLRRPRLCRSRR